jgi:subtilisin family serine protease
VKRIGILLVIILWAYPAFGWNYYDNAGITPAEPALKVELAQGGLDRPVPIDPSISQDEPTDSAYNAPNDPLFDLQHHFAGIIGETLAIDGTWSRLTSSRVIVAIIDSGIDYEHHDLIDNIWTNIGEIPDNGVDDDENGYIDDYVGYNFFDNEPDPYDDHMHGTHVAGIIGAVGNNGIGITGILWEVQLMALRFTNEYGIGDTTKAIEAIHYAVSNGARVINLSWTVKSGSSSSGSQTLQDVIRSYRDQGVVFVAAAGNGNTDYEGVNIDENPVYPASISSPNLISVSASETDGQLAFYSNYGVNSVHIVAPGSEILSTMPENRYGRMTGTSAATGVVSAAAAMILTEAPDLTAEQVKNLLINTANVDSDFAGYVQSSGSLNILEPLNAVGSNLILADTETSSSNTSSSLDVSSSGGCSLNTETNAASSFPLPSIIIFLLILSTLTFRISSILKISNCGDC